jgi:hypothetical protein
MTLKYNLYIKTNTSTFNIIDVNDNDLSKILEVYKYGKKSVFIKGKKYWLEGVSEIQIYSFEEKTIENDLIKDEKSLISLANKFDFFKRNNYGDKWFIPDILENFGERITEDYITDDFGYLKDERIVETTDLYVDAGRIDQINCLNGQEFDFIRLVAILKELNIAYSHNLHLSIPPLVRVVIDHVPPLFEKANFADVCGSHGTKSFRESISNLNKSSRKIADSFLHTQIRRKESLPNKTQVNFKNDLDVLLQEIVRIRKK